MKHARTGMRGTLWGRSSISEQRALLRWSMGETMLLLSKMAVPKIIWCGCPPRRAKKGGYQVGGLCRVGDGGRLALNPMLWVCRSVSHALHHPGHLDPFDQASEAAQDRIAVCHPGYVLSSTPSPCAPSLMGSEGV